MTTWQPTWDLRSIPDPQFHSEAARRRGRTSTRRAKVLRQCPKCQREFGAREMRAHVPACKNEPYATATRKTGASVTH